MQNAVCSGCSIKISPQEETAESAFPSRGLHQAQQNPLGIAAICITICCCLSGTQEWDTFRENTTCFSGAHYREGDCRSVCGGWEERTLPHFSITLPNEINENPPICHIFNFGTGPHTHPEYAHPPHFYCLFCFYLWGATQLQPLPPIPCSLHHPVFSSRPVTWNCAWIIFSVDKAAVLFFTNPLDRTSTKEWTSHQADFFSAEGENTLMARDGPPPETMGSPWLHTFNERPDTIWQKYQRSEVLV